MKYFLLTIVGLLLWGCSDFPNPKSEDSIFLLKKVMKNGNLLSEYEYDDKKRIKLSRYYYQYGEVSGESRYTYVNDTIIEEYSSGRDGDVSLTTHFYRINNQLSRADYFYEGEEGLSHYTYYTFPSFIGCGMVKSETYHGDTFSGREDEFMWGYYYNYTDHNCSYEVERVSDHSSDSRIEYVKDDKKSAYTSTILRSVFRITSTRHNTIEKTIIEGQNNNVFANEYISTYEYNSSGYPVSQKRDRYSRDWYGVKKYAFSENYSYEYYE